MPCQPAPGAIVLSVGTSHSPVKAPSQSCVCVAKPCKPATAQYHAPSSIPGSAARAVWPLLLALGCQASGTTATPHQSMWNLYSLRCCPALKKAVNPPLQPCTPCDAPKPRSTSPVLLLLGCSTVSPHPPHHSPPKSSGGGEGCHRPRCCPCRQHCRDCQPPRAQGPSDAHDGPPSAWPTQARCRREGAEDEKSVAAAGQGRSSCNAASHQTNGALSRHHPTQVPGKVCRRVLSPPQAHLATWSSTSRGACCQASVAATASKWSAT